MAYEVQVRSLDFGSGDFPFEWQPAFRGRFASAPLVSLSGLPLAIQNPLNASRFTSEEHARAALVALQAHCASDTEFRIVNTLAL